MKKTLILLLHILLILTLCACSGSDEPYTVEKGWRTFEVDPGAQTISFKEDIYKYAISDAPSGYKVTITYPDGSTYSESNSENNTTISTSEDYNRYSYIEGGILCDVIADEITDALPIFYGHNPFAGALAILFGLFFLWNPRIVWWLECGWHFKDAEPSKLALVVNQIIGGLLIILGILMFFFI